MKKLNIRPQWFKDMIEISHRLRRGGLTSGAGGGISLSVPGEEVVLIKGWEVASEDVTQEDIAVVDPNGQPLNSVKPCLETPLHLEVLKTRKDIKAVIHAHPPYATAFGNIQPGLNEAALKNYPFLKMAVFTPYAEPGSIELAEIVARPFQNKDILCVLMEDHGVTVGGTDIFDAYYRLDMLEGMAKSFVLTLLLRRGLAAFESLLKGSVG